MTDRLEDPGEDPLPENQRGRRRALQKRLVQVIRRIALKPEEIDALPDNLTQAANAGAFRKTFNPKDPNQFFFPIDLLFQEGSWIPVNNFTREYARSLTALEHVRFTRGRSVFTVFLRLPEGRQATEAFVKRTQDGDLPQFPEGAQTALLRRMLLIDSSGTLHASPITESLQIRVYQKLDLGFPFEFTLRRTDLFAGRHGGLRAVSATEASYFDFQTRGADVFEMYSLSPATPIIDLHPLPRPHQ